MIIVDKISKKFGNVVAIENASFSVNDGEITALLGPNGAGKTTALRCIYGLAKPDDGQVTINNIDMAKNPQAGLSHIGVLPDAKGIYNRLTAIENIAFFGRLHGMTEQQINERISWLIDILGMHEFAQRRCEGFSLGQRVKVAISRALIHNPAHLLLDEPTSGLDVSSVRALRRLLLTLREQGHSILFSSHVMQEVEMLCDRIVIIAKGHIIADGSVEKICSTANTNNLEDAFIKLTGEEE
ncbi:MAG: ABC transporter ATP-binding protein [bacterium]